MNKTQCDCLCVRCFKYVGFLGMLVPLVLHIWVLHNVLLLSDVAISTFAIQQWTTEDFTHPCNNFIFHSEKTEGNKGLIALGIDS